MALKMGKPHDPKHSVSVLVQCQHLLMHVGNNPEIYPKHQVVLATVLVKPVDSGRLSMLPVNESTPPCL